MTKLTAKTVVQALSAFLRHYKNKAAEIPHGKQTVKQLIGQNQGISTIPVDQTDLKGVEKAAKKYGVDFAVTKNKTVDPPQYTVFVKAHDAEALNAALDAYTSRKLKEKPSVLQMLRNLQEKAKSVVAPVREKKQERER